MVDLGIVGGNINPKDIAGAIKAANAARNAASRIQAALSDDGKGPLPTGDDPLTTFCRNVMVLGDASRHRLGLKNRPDNTGE